MSHIYVIIESLKSTLNLIAYSAKHLQFLCVRSLCWVVKAHVQLLANMTKESRTILLGSSANRYDIIPCLIKIFTYIMGRSV